MLRWSKLVVGTIVAIMILSACVAPAAGPQTRSTLPPATQPASGAIVKTGGTMVWGINSDITQTSLISTKPAQWVYGTMLDQLVSFDPKTFQVFRFDLS